MAKTPRRTKRVKKPATTSVKQAAATPKQPAATRGTPPPKPGRPQLRLPTPKTAAGKKVDPLRLQKVEAAAVEATRERHQQGGDATVNRRHLQRYPIDDSIRDVTPHNWATADRQLLKPGARAGLKRMFLHAWRLQFNHPVTDERVALQADLPPELKAYIDHAPHQTPPV